MAGNDRTSLVRLLVSHYSELTRHLSRRLGSPQCASDVVHDTYLRLQGLKAVPDMDNPRAYLFRMADNLAIDRLRAQGREGRRRDGEEVLAVQPSETPDAEASADYRQRLRLLARAVDELPPRCREVFLMHKMDGLGHAEIARRLGISRSAVEKHVMRALAHCRDRLVV